MSRYGRDENLSDRLRPLEIVSQCQEFGPDSPGTTYNLGNGVTTQNASEAASTLTDREYPEVKGGRSKTTFIPNSFLSRYAKVVEFDDKEILAKMQEMEMATTREKREKKDYDIDQVKGEASECSMFQRLKEVLGNVEGLVVFHSYEWWLSKELNGQMDFLIVCMRTKTIINIECKSNFHRVKLNKALKQLDKHYNFLTSKLPFGPGWQFVKVVSFTQDTDWCEVFKPYVVGPSSTLDAVRDHIGPQIPSTGTPITPACRQEYYDIVSRLAFLLSRSYSKNPGAKKSIANEMLLDNLDKRSEPENVILWSRDQLAVLSDATQKKVVLTSHFGTGKTILLKAKALATAREHEDKSVFFIICPPPYRVNSGTLLSEELKMSTKGQENLKVLSWIDLEKEVKEKVKDDQDKDEEWFEDKEQVFKTFVHIHLGKTAGIFLDELHSRFLFSIKKFNIEALQPLKNLLGTFSKNKRTRFCEKVAEFFKKADLERIMDEYKDDPEMQAFILDGQSVVNNKDSIWSFLSKFLKLWNQYVVDDEKTSRKNNELFLDLMGIVNKHFIPEVKGYWPRYKVEHLLQCTLHAVHLLKHLNSLKDYNGLIWIAANSDDVIWWSDKLLCHEYTQFWFPKLEYNMRSIHGIADRASLQDVFSRKYKKPSNVIEGKKPIVTDLIILSGKNDQEKVDELFGQFKIALEKLDNDTDDLLVTHFELGSKSFLEPFFKRIQDYCREKEIPCCNCLDEEHLQKNVESFLTNGRKGIVLGDEGSVQGFEFKSVILVSDTVYLSKYDTSIANVLLRARINLYVINYKYR